MKRLRERLHGVVPLGHGVVQSCDLRGETPRLLRLCRQVPRDRVLRDPFVVYTRIEVVYAHAGGVGVGAQCVFKFPRDAKSGYVFRDVFSERFLRCGGVPRLDLHAQHRHVVRRLVTMA